MCATTLVYPGSKDRQIGIDWRCDASILATSMFPEFEIPKRRRACEWREGLHKPK
jgi:hypothetical protein